MILEYSQEKDLNALAACYMRTFPKSLATALGYRYAMKTLEWFLEEEYNFIFHIIDSRTDRIIGFCGAMVNDGIYARGSSSGMIQYAFDEGLKSLARKPWLLFHREMLSKVDLVYKNLLKRIWRLFGKSHFKKSYAVGSIMPFVGLVVIAIDPDFQNLGLGQTLLKEFEQNAIRLGYGRVKLSVSQKNTQAIRAYEKNGWIVTNTKKNSMSMIKNLDQPGRSGGRILVKQL